MSITAISMGVIVLVIAVIDVFLIKKKGKQSSISAYIIRYYNFNRLAFLTTIGVGITLGHLFWSMRQSDYLNKKEFAEVCKETLGGTDAIQIVCGNPPSCPSGN